MDALDSIRPRPRRWILPPRAHGASSTGSCPGSPSTSGCWKRRAIRTTRCSSACASCRSRPTTSMSSSWCGSPASRPGCARLRMPQRRRPDAASSCGRSATQRRADGAPAGRAGRRSQDDCARPASPCSTSTNSPPANGMARRLFPRPDLPGADADGHRSGASLSRSSPTAASPWSLKLKQTSDRP